MKIISNLLIMISKLAMSFLLLIPAFIFLVCWIASSPFKMIEKIMEKSAVSHHVASATELAI